MFLYGWENFTQRSPLKYFIALGLLNFAGAATYAARMPERWFPRTFDIYGASHQIMHVMVVGGGLTYSIGLLKAFDRTRTARLVAENVC